MAGTPSEQGEARRIAILEMVQDSRKDRGFPPTIAELVSHVGISRSAVVWHLKALIAGGLISADEENLSRSLTLTRKGSTFLKTLRSEANQGHREPVTTTSKTRRSRTVRTH